MPQSRSKMVSLGKLTAGIAHEINNPLMIVTGNIEHLQRLSKFESTPKETIAKISKATTSASFRIAKIVETLMSTTESSREKVLSKIDILDVIDKIIQHLKSTPLWDNVDISIDSNRHTGDFLLDGDAAQIQLLFSHVIKNAFFAAKNNTPSWVRIALNNTDHSIIVAISNAGPPIDSEMHEKIFEPFYTTKENGDGTGLGLSISRSICEAHGGNISIDTESENTCFIIELEKESLWEAC